MEPRREGRRDKTRLRRLSNKGAAKGATRGRAESFMLL